MGLTTEGFCTPGSQRKVPDFSNVNKYDFWTDGHAASYLLSPYFMLLWRKEIRKCHASGSATIF